MKKCLPLLLLGALTLSSCTTPVSELNKIGAVEDGGTGFGSAWEAEQEGAYTDDESSTETTVGELPFYTFLSKTTKTGMFAEDTDDIVAMSSFLLPISAEYADEDGLVVQASNAFSGFFGTGSYTAEFSCQGAGDAILKVYIGQNGYYAGQDEQQQIPVTCSLPAGQGHAQFELGDSNEDVLLGVFAKPDVIGTFDLRVHE